jgi:hypothetical protein
VTETREFDEVRARLQRFDLGPLPDIDLDDVVRRGHSHRRRAFAERVLAVAAVAALIVGVAVAVPHLGREPEPPVVVSPTPTSTGAPTPTPSDPSPTPTESAPISVPVLEESVPQPLGAEQGPVAMATSSGRSRAQVPGSPVICSRRKAQNCRTCASGQKSAPTRPTSRSPPPACGS